MARSLAVHDAAPRNWLDRHAPEWLKPYGRLARWDRPIGWWLLLWPCWWSATLSALAAGERFPSVPHLLLFLVGAVAMRGAGCTYNDIVDRDLDAKVARTRSRPLPSGAVRPAQAAAFLVLQALVGALVLLRFNGFTIVLGLASLLVVAVYPFAKRVTDWPQLVLGLAFSWGALLGWSARFGELGAAAVALYAGAVLWTIAYDTIYALQDREDDALIGVRSTAHLTLMGFAFVLAGAGAVAFAALGAALLFAAWLVATLDPADPENCLRRFRKNTLIGWIVFAGLLADAALA
jgi:4-hydroxybenzoate polyprenyltransferase